MSRSRQTREIVASPYTTKMATMMVTDQTSRQRTRHRPLVVVIAAALAGFGLASIVIWVVDAAGPTRTVSAVITRDDQVEHDDDGLRYEYVDQARTDDGELVGLPSLEQLWDSVSYGSPVRIEFSTITRNVVSVRSAEGLIRTGTGTVGLVLLGLYTVALVAGTLVVGWLDARLWPAVPSWLAGFHVVTVPVEWTHT
jgi:hypothetical protein